MGGTYSFTASHRGGSGSPLVCLHGFMDTWRVWELVLPALERRHDVLAVTLPGHAGGPRLGRDVSADTFVDAVEDLIEQAGFSVAHLVGSSLGGYIALRLAARGRATTVVTFAPAGGWARDDHSSPEELLRAQRELHELMKALAPQAPVLLATPEGRRRATRLITTNFEHIPSELLAHEMLGIAACQGAQSLIESARRDGWALDAQSVTCPVRIVWGNADKLLPWPEAAVRYRVEWLPHADWVLLDGIGHCPHLDVPLEAAQLILDFA